MNITATSLTADRLRQLLSYDQESGIFRWKIAPRGHTIGAVAGRTDSKGHRQIRIDGCAYLSHRLAWLYVYGRWPTDQIDHKNGIRDDNSFQNLREASNAENTQNARRARSNNKVGLLGVSPSFGKFKAQIAVNGKKIHLGQFVTKEEAHAAYV